MLKAEIFLAHSKQYTKASPKHTFTDILTNPAFYSQCIRQSHTIILQHIFCLLKKLPFFKKLKNCNASLLVALKQNYTMDNCTTLFNIILTYAHIFNFLM
jgi:hypothetical protein